MLCASCTLLRVLGVAPLPTSEQRREREARRVQLLQDGIEALLTRVGRVQQRFHAADGQSVCSSTVCCGEVADHAAVNPGELRNTRSSSPQSCISVSRA
jgi:hypothetical protein